MKMSLKNFLKNTFCTQSFGGLIDCGLTIFQDKTYFYPNVSRTKLLLPKFVRVRIFSGQIYLNQKIFIPQIFFGPNIFCTQYFLDQQL